VPDSRPGRRLGGPPNRPPRPGYVKRVTVTERVLRWGHARAFFVLLASGLVLYLPALSSAVCPRPLIKDVHFWARGSLAGGSGVERRLVGGRCGGRRRARRVV